MAIRKSWGRVIFEWVNYIILGIVMIITLFPVLHVLASSLSGQIFIEKGQIGIIPRGINIDAYKRVISYAVIWSSYLNTIIYTVIYVIVSLFITTTGAYTLSRKNFFGKKFLVAFVVFPLMFNAGLVPTFLVVKGIGLYNSIWAIILPQAVFTYYLVIMRTFYQQIPYELEEAAIIDGCSQFKVLWKIILPLSVPAMVTIGLFYAVYQWNSFINPLIYLNDKAKFPIQLVLRDIVIQNQTDEMMETVVQKVDIVSESIKYASIIVAALPIMMLYPFLQKYFVKGMLLGSVKG